MYKLIGQSKNIYFRCCLICYFQFRGGSTRLSKLQTDGDQVIIITKLSDFFKVSVLVKSLFPEVTFECCQWPLFLALFSHFFPVVYFSHRRSTQIKKPMQQKLTGASIGHFGAPLIMSAFTGGVVQQAVRRFSRFVSAPSTNRLVFLS